MKTTTKVYTINAANVDELADKYERYTLAAQPAADRHGRTHEITTRRRDTVPDVRDWPAHCSHIDVYRYDHTAAK